MEINDAILLPCSNTGVTQGYTNTHRGLDFGWISYEYSHNVWAIDEGKVIVTESYKIGGDRGEYIVLEHTREGKKRYSAYLHLLENSIKVKVGDKVKRGQLLAYMGNTGLSNGKHLHLYVSSYTNLNETYSYVRMKELCNNDPSKNLVLSKDKVWNITGNMLSNLQYIEDLEKDDIKADMKKIYEIAKKYI